MKLMHTHTQKTLKKIQSGKGHLLEVWLILEAAKSQLPL